MISCLKNSDGFVLAFIEWQIVNEKGQFKDLGEYCYIQDFWIHETWRRDRLVLDELVQLIASHRFSRNMKTVYWLRGKYNDRISSYPKDKFIKKESQNGWVEKQCASSGAG